MAENKEYLKHEKEIGSVNISEDVLASIAAVSAVEVDGVTALASGINFTEIFGTKKPSKGVKIQLSENLATVDIYLSVKYGFVIPSVAAQVQDKIINAIESMTGLTVAAVNVHVSGVTFEKETETVPASDAE